MKTREEKIKEIIQACIKVNPKIVTNKNAQLIKYDRTIEYFEEKRPTRLADVLAAMGQRVIDSSTLSNGTTFHMFIVNYGAGNWKLLEDDIRLQDNEMVDFAHYLTCPKTYDK